MKSHFVLFACVLIAWSGVPALAHAFLKHADPGAGAVLPAAPNRAVLVFTEQLEPVFSGVTVTNAAGRNVEAGTPVIGGNTMVAPLIRLAPGRYRVTWHAVSVDTHRTQGAYSFTVKR
jgi:methionine-rich copper-binding protein CopC